MGQQKASVDIPGWFQWVDQLIFKAVLKAQSNLPPATVVELGTYLGKSAVLIGDYVRQGEQFVALDLFGRTDLIDGSGDANRREVSISYKTLTRTKFEENYLSRHEELPTIVEAASSSIVDYIQPSTVRFLHVDASHMYEHVRIDARNARILLQPGGVVVFDDWRSEHTPGVTAAVWEAVYANGLIPVVLTPAKFYGVFSHPDLLRTTVKTLVSDTDDLWSEDQRIAGHDVVRVRLKHHRKQEPPPVVDYARLEVLMEKVADSRWTKWSQELETRTRRATLDASSITRLRRWARGGRKKTR